MRLAAFSASWLSGLCLLLFAGCATDSAVAGDVGDASFAPVTAWEEDSPSEAAGLGFTRDGALERLPGDSRELLRARQAEAARVVRELWDIAGERGTPGEAWTLEYQARGGSLTLLSFHRTSAGSGRGAPVAWSTFARGLADGLPTLVGDKSRRILFSLRREERGWRIDLDTRSGSAPVQTRTVPVALPRAPAAVLSQTLGVARGLVLKRPVPRGGRVRLEARVHFEGASLQSDFEGGTFEVVQQGGPPEPRAAVVPIDAVVNALLPFSQGVGSRSVDLELEGTSSRGEPDVSWRVVMARTVEPPKPPEEMEDFAREYRAMHEDILRHWRAEVKDSARLAGAWSFEQLAYWYVGGLIARGALSLFEAAAPTVTSVLSRGGQHAVRWFRTVLVRAPPGEREALQRLWMKVEAEGLIALSPTEKAELQRLMGKLEQALHTPLDRAMKKRIRQWARQEYFETINPRLAAELGPARMRFYEIHHRIPMEYAQLFPQADINAAKNLVAVEETVHKSINRVWEVVGSQSQRLEGAQVERIARIVDDEYGRWFHMVVNPSQSASAVVTAEQNALRAVKALLEP